MRKTKMTLSDHIRLSVRLAVARAALSDGYVNILQHHVRKDSSEMRKMRKALDTIDELRSQMDDIVCGEKPDGVGTAYVRVYYDTGIQAERNGEFSSVMENYAVRHATTRLLEGSGRQMDADEITLTTFDSSFSKHIREDSDRNSHKFLRVKKGTGYVTSGSDGTVSRRPPEDQINPNQTTYALVPCQIRDFCEDAMQSGAYPTDEEIERAVGRYYVESEVER